ncbi:MAG: hypothetical protein HUU57_10340 [Bdellovibrio sp.]|nr:hypothetical protein [Bdellovibrio sp.]
MTDEYVEKMLSLDLEKMNLGELLNYLEFLLVNQVYYHKKTENRPFQKKYFEVIQFIIEKYDFIDPMGIK